MKKKTTKKMKKSMGKNMKKGKMLFILVCIGVVIVSSTGCSAGYNNMKNHETVNDSSGSGTVGATDTSKGYVAKKIVLPWKDQGEIADLCKLSDDSIAVVSEKGMMCTFADKGEKWIIEDSNNLQDWLKKYVVQEVIAHRYAYVKMEKL